jgi:hypothetical protein
MKIMFRYTLILLFLTLPIYSYSQKRMQISGQVVDENNKPVVGATVNYVYEPDNFSQDGLTVSYKSLDDGYFGFVVDWREKKKIRIFVEAPVRNCYNAVTTSNGRARKYLSFQSILIEKYKPKIFLGKIQNYNRFTTVTFDLTKQSNELVENIKNMQVYLLLQDSYNNLILNSTINTAYYEKSRSLELCLPIGTWNMDIFDFKTNKLIFKYEKLKTESENIQLTLELNKQIYKN